MTTLDTVTLIANLALTASFIAALIFGLAQVRGSQSDRRERLTLDTLRNFQTAEFARLSLFITSKRMPKNRAEMAALPLEDQVTVFQFSQMMESLGIMVGEGLIDIDLVDITLGSYVYTTWDQYKPLFMEMRAYDPFIGEYYQWLAGCIEKRMSQYPRRPFFEINPPSANIDLRRRRK